MPAAATTTTDEGPSVTTLRRQFVYDPARGVLIWRERPATDFGGTEKRSVALAALWNARFAGNVAGTLNEDGYRVIRLNKRGHMMHRLIWLYFHGELPSSQIDHVFGVAAGNFIENLRPATHDENAKNRRVPINNVSGYMGVHWNRLNNRWNAYISADGKRVHLGSFINRDDAISTRKAAELRHGYHANHGRKVA